MSRLDGLWPPFRANVEALLADPDAVALGVYVVSGFRSDELQAALFADAVRRYGSERKARRWVAPPGKSNHGPRVNAAGQRTPNGPYGIAVDLGIPGIPAVEGQWPLRIEAQMLALADRYEMFSPLEWEDWHHEPKASMFARPHPPVAAPPTLPKEDAMKMVVIDPKSPADKHGRLPNWEADQDGNLYNWNGARFLKPLSAFAKTHPPIVAIALEPGGDGVVLFGDDTQQEPDGAWVRSTYKITVDMA